MAALPHSRLAGYSITSGLSRRLSCGEPSRRLRRLADLRYPSAERIGFSSLAY